MDCMISPGEGERRAQRGYGRQYEPAAAAICAALDNGDLLWVGLADRSAGIETYSARFILLASATRSRRKKIPNTQRELNC